jgi:hypothetical protein
LIYPSWMLFLKLSGESYENTQIGDNMTRFVKFGIVFILLSIFVTVIPVTGTLVADFTYPPEDTIMNEEGQGPGGQEGTEVHFDGSVSQVDAGRYIVNVCWDFGDVRTDENGNSIYPSCNYYPSWFPPTWPDTHIYWGYDTQLGYNKTVTLTIQDNGFHYSTKSKTIRLKYRPQLMLTVGGEEIPWVLYIHSGDTLLFDASNSSDRDGHIDSYSWDFYKEADDGGLTRIDQYTLTVPQTSRTFLDEGWYKYELYVTDNDGLTSDIPWGPYYAWIFVEKKPLKINIERAWIVPVLGNLPETANGGITGTVTDDDGNLITDAKVWIEGHPEFYTYTESGSPGNPYTLYFPIELPLGSPNEPIILHAETSENAGNSDPVIVYNVKQHPSDGYSVNNNDILNYGKYYVNKFVEPEGVVLDVAKEYWVGQIGYKLINGISTVFNVMTAFDAICYFAVEHNYEPAVNDIFSAELTDYTTPDGTEVQAECMSLIVKRNGQPIASKEMWFDPQDLSAYSHIYSPYGMLVNVESPVVLNVRDPNGKYAGYDPTTGLLTADFPISISAPGDEPFECLIPYAKNGEYTLSAIGTDGGSYNLTIQVLNQNWQVIRSSSDAGQIQKGQIIDYSETLYSILALPSYPIATDPDSDGLYEDLNGNARKDFNDVVLMFNQMQWIAVNEPVSAFDFNGNGRIDFNDIVKLFGKI